MSAKKSTGTRYSPEQKAAVIAFVADYNSKHKRGGQAAAAKKFDITPLSISQWVRKAAKGTKPAIVKAVKKPTRQTTEKAAAKRVARKKGTAKARGGAKAKPAASSAALLKLSELAKAIVAVETELAKGTEQLAQLKTRLAAALKGL
jgi:transposase-like protein